MMIQAVLGNPHHPEYGVATIPFPIPRDQHAHCMELLEALERIRLAEHRDYGDPVRQQRYARCGGGRYVL